MKRLEEEVEEWLKQSGQWGEMHEAAEEYLQWLRIEEAKKPVNGLSEIVKSFTGAPGLAILMGSALAHPFVQELFDGLFDVMSGAIDDLSYAMEDMTTYGMEDIVFELLDRRGLIESLWLTTFAVRPVLLKLSPELFVGMIGLLGSKGLKVNMLPVVLSIAAPLMQKLFTEEGFAHLGDLESYVEDGLYRYIGKEEE
jgi:hypothetical protein